MGKSLYRVLAEIFDDMRTDAVRRVLRDAEIDPNRVDLSGNALDVWFRVEEEAVKLDVAGALVRAAEKELGREHKELREALDALVDDAQQLLPWMFDLDRDEQRKAAQRFNAPATALVIVGPRDAGHRYVSLWGRMGYRSRRPPVEIAWPREVAGEPTRIRALLLELIEVFELDALRNEINGHSSALHAEESMARGAWPDFLRRLRDALVDAMFPTRSAGTKSLAVVRHEVREPRDEDALVLDEYVRHVWAPLAARMKSEPGSEARCVVAFEFHCGGERHDAFVRSVAKHATREGHVAAPHIAPLRRVTEDDVIFWLTRYNQNDALYRRMKPSVRRSLLADGEDADSVAARILRRTSGNYEEIINLFRGD